MSDAILLQLIERAAEAECLRRLLDVHGNDLPSLLLARLAVELDMQSVELAKHRTAISDALCSV